jgi:hypothetical protein
MSNLSTFNTLKSSSKSFGGGVPVWKVIKGKIMSGGLLPSDIGKGLYPAGTPVYIDTANHTAKILNCYVVAADVATEGTSVSVKVIEGRPDIKSTTIVMCAPATAEAKGKSVTVGALTDGTDGEGKPVKTFTITAGALGALKAGDYLFEASAAGSSASLAVKPNALLENDILIDEDVCAATATGVYHGDIYADRVRWALPDFVKAALPQIFFDYSL